MGGDQKGSVKLADRYFDESVQGFLDLEWDPNRQVLFPRRASMLAVNPKQMNLRLSPIEGRHESMLRAAVTMIASLRHRIRDLEALHPELNEKPQEAISEVHPFHDTPDPPESSLEPTRPLPEPPSETPAS